MEEGLCLIVAQGQSFPGFLRHAPYAWTLFAAVLSGVGVGCSYPHCRILAYTLAVTDVTCPVQSMAIVIYRNLVWFPHMYKVCIGLYVPQYRCEVVVSM